jgi:hypothetical protein
MKLVSKKIVLLLAMTLASGYLSTKPCPADDAAGAGHDWTVRLSTQQLAQAFSYKGAALFPVDRIDATYYKNDQSSSVKYEKLWYHAGKPVGLERQGAFGNASGQGIPAGEGVFIEVINKNGMPQDGELKAAANAIMRIWIDAYLNHSPLITVKVPAHSFNSIEGYLETQRCVEIPAGNVEQTRTGTMNFLLISEPKGLKAKMAYTP